MSTKPKSKRKEIQMSAVGGIVRGNRADIKQQDLKKKKDEKNIKIKYEKYLQNSNLDAIYEEEDESQRRSTVIEKKKKTNKLQVPKLNLDFDSGKKVSFHLDIPQDDNNKYASDSTHDKKKRDRGLTTSRANKKITYEKIPI